MQLSAEESSHLRCGRLPYHWAQYLQNGTCLLFVRYRSDIYHWCIVLESGNTRSDRLSVEINNMWICNKSHALWHYHNKQSSLFLSGIWERDICYYTDHSPAQQLWPVARTRLLIGHITASESTYRPSADSLQRGHLSVSDCKRRNDIYRKAACVL